jgi:thiamine pyrophosphate-dependent acetolactate synthase large subunit-like protein
LNNNTNENLQASVSAAQPTMAEYVYELLAETFVREDPGHCFALLGDANMKWAQAMLQRGCPFTYVRDEHCAVAAAMAWSRTTGRTGIATVTCGPGLTQIMTALPIAVRAQIPLVIFAGEAPLHKPWYNQAIDQAPLVEACGARYQPLHSIDLMTEQIRDAFLYAQQHQCPVVLGVPMDLQSQRAPQPCTLPAPSAQLLPPPDKRPPAAEELAKAIKQIQAARRIIVMAGLGAARSGASAACQLLAQRTGALLATTLPARGLFHDDPWCIGIVGGFSTKLTREYLSQADLIVAVGCRLAQHNSSDGKLFSADLVLQIDLHPGTVSQGRIAARSHIRGDAKVAIQALLEQLPAQQTDNTQWRSDATAAAIAASVPDDHPYPAEPGLHDPRRVVQALDSTIPKHWHVVNSSGHCSWFFAHMYQRPADRFLTIREFGAIGNGLSYAIGVAVARPEEPVVLFDGDGSFLMHAQELETIRRHALNILVVVMNDGAYGSEIHKLRAHGLGDGGAVFGHSDLAAIARGFGIAAEKIETLDQLKSTLTRFTAHNGATLWDFHVSDKIASPALRA